jgi:hypothetical protein
LKPYKGGNLALRTLHDLDLLDKHNDLIPTYGAGVHEKDVFIGGLGLINTRFELVDGFAPFAVPGTGATILRPVPLKLIAKFRDDQPFGGQEIVPALNSLAELISGIVEAFAALYSR